MFIQHLSDRDLKEDFIIVDNIVEHDWFIRRYTDIDNIFANIGNLQIFNPCSIRYVRKAVFITNMFLDPQPPLSDNFVVHSIPRFF